MMRRNPQRTAWLVILSAFAAFVLLCASIPLSVRYYLEHTTTPQPATLDVIGGTVRVREASAAAPIALTKSMQLSEGTSIETDENSRGILTFLDGSTAILFPGTQITLRQMRIPTFPWGVESTSILLEQTRGRIRIGVAQLVTQFDSAPRKRQFQVHTPQLLSLLSEGSYVVELTGDASQIIVRDGTAAVTAQERTVKVGRGQRTVTRNNEPPLPPVPAIQDLIVNGDFNDPLARGWTIVADSAQGSGNLYVLSLNDRKVVQILRTNSKQTSAITGMIQSINREVSDYRTLKLAADVRVHFQSLSGGGILSSEYPLIIRLKYRDVYGSEAEWVHGFYYQNTTNNPTNNGEKISEDIWVPFETGNLLELAAPRPFFITSLQIYASGWDYESFVTGVRLSVE